MRKFSEDRFLADLYTKDPVQANFLQRLIDSIDNVARSTGVAMAGDLTPPPPVNAMTVKTSGEMIHATLTHSAEVNRAIHYFVEADTSPSFTQPQIVSEGARRTHVFHLPTLDDSGKVQKWYLRAYPQYPGSKPSQPTVLGGASNPQALTLQGTTKMTLLPSTGSGTASTTGQQGGAGRGKQRVSTPKVLRVGKSQASNAAVVPPVMNPAIHLLAAVASASQTTSLTQSGTSTAINVAQGVFYLGDLVLRPFAGVVDPGSYGTFFVYHDDPNLQGGNVAYKATTDVTDLGKAYARFYDGTITTSNTGGGSGGGSGGGGGRHCFTGESLIRTPWGFVRFDRLPKVAIIENETGRWLADLVVHEDCDEEVIVLADATRVSLTHRIKHGNDWIAAGKLFPDKPREQFNGKLYNLHVRDDGEQNKHFVVYPRLVAHNQLK